MRTVIKIARKEASGVEDCATRSFELYSDLETWSSDFQSNGIEVSLEGNTDEVELLYEHLKEDLLDSFFSLDGDFFPNNNFPEDEDFLNFLDL